MEIIPKGLLLGNEIMGPCETGKITKINTKRRTNISRKISAVIETFHSKKCIAIEVNKK